MSTADTATSRDLARATRNVLKGAGARLAGKERGPDRRVRRDSYDIDDPRAQVWRRIEDGSKASGLAWADALLQTAEEFDVVHKKKGERGPLQANGLRVLAAIVRRALDFTSGRSEPELLTLVKWTGLSKPAVVGALARLREHGFLDWIRRSIRAGEKGQPGPQRKQTSNAYFFGFGRMRDKHKGVWQRFRQLLARKLANAAARSPGAAQTAPTAPTPPSGPLGIALASLGNAVASASS
jgi:hypothetical protein